MNASNTTRLFVVDALRGFAIVSIMLLHNIEHFDMYHFPEGLPEWLNHLNGFLWDALFFLFGGKSYAIFALLFGLTFHIQSENQRRRGNNFSGRFAWRMLLLLVFGLINSAFYQGDILMLYAVVGLFLIPVGKLKDAWALALAVFLFLLPVEWVHLANALKNPGMELANPESWTYFGKMGAYIGGDSLWATLYGNLTNGKTAVLLWNWENGRFFQMLGLFILGMLAGRKSLFVWTDKHQRFWKRTFFISILTFIPLFVLQKKLGQLISNEAIRRPLATMETSWTNLAFMFFLVASFVWLYYATRMHKPLNVFTPFGKMSLSNYVIQSIIGSSIYYGFGLGLYQVTSTYQSLLIGLTLVIGLWFFCNYWAQHFKRGPLETIWHRLTWLGTKV